jgi:hypothetical protein
MVGVSAMTAKSVADIEGPWREPVSGSGLIAQCRDAWQVPVDQLSDEIVAAFLRQKIALQIVIPEARRRVDLRLTDDSELYDGELIMALQAAEMGSA